MMAPNLKLRKTIGTWEIYERTPKPKGSPKYIVTPAGNVTGHVTEYGKYSTAIRWCKAQLPRVVPHVVIVMDGDSVVRVVSTAPINYTVVDVNADLVEDDDDDDFPMLPMEGIGGNRTG